jgi:hypothetical protein
MFIPGPDHGSRSRIRILIFYPSRIQVSKRHRISNTVVQFYDVCCVRLAEEVCVDGHETTLLSLKSYPPGFLKKMVLELGSHLDTIHAVQAGITNNHSQDLPPPIRIQPALY